MRNGYRQHAQAFPDLCEVRGCPASPEEWFEVGRLTFDVCPSHSLQLRAGEAHTIIGDEILLGAEAASDLLGSRALKTPTGTVLTLVLGHHGVADQEIPIRVTGPVREELTSLLGTAHCEGDPESPDGRDEEHGADGGAGSSS